MRFLVLNFLTTFASIAIAVSPNRPGIQGRIVGGSNANIKDFKYQASLRVVGIHHCGATIINKRWLITAAHCFDGNIPSYQVSFRLGSAYAESGGKVFKAELVRKYPGFTTSNMNNDLALVRTDEDMFGDNIEPIEMVEENFEHPPGTTSVISGWGYLYEKSGTFAEQLQFANLSLVDRSKCEGALSYLHKITNEMICAAAVGKDACQGDSGGPMVVNGKLVGVVSWGKGCASQTPGVYTNLASSKLRSWIKDTIAASN